jgi:hypothetical protein
METEAQTLEVKFYRVGTLRYTVGALAVVFTWLLWGDFCNTIYL